MTTTQTAQALVMAVAELAEATKLLNNIYPKGYGLLSDRLIDDLITAVNAIESARNRILRIMEPS